MSRKGRVLRFIFIIFNVFVFVCPHECRCQWMPEILDPQKYAIPVELELQVVVSQLIWFLGTKLGSSVRAVHPPNH